MAPKQDRKKGKKEKKTEDKQSTRGDALPPVRHPQDEESTSGENSDDEELVMGRITVEMLFKLLKKLDKRLENLQRDVKESNGRVTQIEERQTKLEEKVDDVTDAVNNLDYQETQIAMERMESELEDAKNEIKELKEENLRLQRYSRGFNLRFGGIAETEGENPIEKLQQILSETFHIEQDGVEYAHRTGQKMPNRPRHIIAKFIRRTTRRQILMDKRKLQDQGIYVKEDLCEADFKKKAKLRPIMKEAYEKGHTVRFSNGVLFIDGQRYQGGRIAEVEREQ